MAKTTYGTINNPVKRDNWLQFTDGKYRVCAKVYDEPSDYGIDCGRISKLDIHSLTTGEEVCNYDRGWDIEPTDEVKALYGRIIKKYN